MTPAAAALLERIERMPQHVDLVQIGPLFELWEAGAAIVHGRWVWSWRRWHARAALRRRP